MNGFFLVALGGAIGASARYGVGLALAQHGGVAGAWSTLTVNVVGSFLLGLLTAWGGERNWPGEEALWLLFGVGMLGAFTTFSTFSRDTVHMFMAGDNLKAIGYMALNLFGSITAFAIALIALRKLLS